MEPLFNREQSFQIKEDEKALSDEMYDGGAETTTKHVCETERPDSF